MDETETTLENTPKTDPSLMHEIIGGVLAAMASIVAGKLMQKAYTDFVVNREVKTDAIEVTATEA